MHYCISVIVRIIELFLLKLVVIYLVSVEEGKFWIHSIKPGFNTRVSRTRNGARCLTIYEHQCSQALPTLRNKSLRARNKVAHVELLRGDVRPVPRYAVTVTYKNQQRKKQKIFSVFRKEKQNQSKKYNDDFWKVVISN